MFHFSGWSKSKYLELVDCCRCGIWGRDIFTTLSVARLYNIEMCGIGIEQIYLSVSKVLLSDRCFKYSEMLNCCFATRSPHLKNCRALLLMYCRSLHGLARRPNRLYAFKWMGQGIKIETLGTGNCDTSIEWSSTVYCLDCAATGIDHFSSSIHIDKE
jgi:hypothetical protein